MTSDPPAPHAPDPDVPGSGLPREPGEPGVSGGDAADDPARRTWSHLRELLNTHGDRRRQVTEALGMSFFRIKALRRVARGPVALRDLASDLLTDRPYTTLVVDDLTGRGLVERIPNPSDRRSKLVRATEAGLAAAAEAERILGTPPPAMYELPPDDLAALDRIVVRILAGPGTDAGEAGEAGGRPPSPAWSPEF
ncbi:MarR family transcriptional regulator [Actinomadura logoneensis]|uniref:MarR family transcriptional regulator n=1 Tax=Actinomadura logoneensis TaxID=2293572 RepID=A0A372J8W6_9ACTN|nr:MarR family transcriptional regulator [Actinomadura logoneensis]RFU36441.1 MarR family transcriptional regulator [Actinomadura logoneensis]